MPDLRAYLEAQAELGEELIFFDEPFTLEIPKSVPKKVSPSQRPTPPPSIEPRAVPPHKLVSSIQTASVAKPKWEALQASVPESAPLEKIASENELKEMVRKNALYAKSEEIIWGFGVQKPELMFVFESPRENLTADSFWASAAGEMLVKMFAGLGLDAKQSYVTFFHKKMAAKKITPLVALELRKMLVRETEWIQPQKIIFWGESLFRLITKNAELFETVGGTAFDFEGTPSVSLIDPYEMLQNTKLKKITWKEHLPRSGFFPALS
ncbi:MAG: hypothetical protein LBR60_00505 [Fibrobacter sp.]|jgi:uracil-DNA glycosylase family 4|nr:hypothetical protein [Fibrobacter sp.]